MSVSDHNDLEIARFGSAPWLNESISVILKNMKTGLETRKLPIEHEVGLSNGAGPIYCKLYRRNPLETEAIKRETERIFMAKFGKALANLRHRLWW